MTTTQRIHTPFGAESTAAEVIEGIDLTGKHAVVTGAASGLGAETARALVGASVTLAVRNTEAGERTATDIRKATGNRCRCCRVDRSSGQCRRSGRRHGDAVPTSARSGRSRRGS